MNRQQKQNQQAKVFYSHLPNISQPHDSIKDIKLKKFISDKINKKSYLQLGRIEESIYKTKNIKERHSIRDFYSSIKRDNSRSTLKSKEQHQQYKDLYQNSVNTSKVQNRLLSKTSLPKTRRQPGINAEKAYLFSNRISRQSINNMPKEVIYSKNRNKDIEKGQQAKVLRKLEKEIFFTSKINLNLMQLGIFSQKKDGQIFLKKLKETLLSEFKQKIDVQNRGDLLKLQFTLLREIHLMGSWIQ